MSKYYLLSLSYFCLLLVYIISPNGLANYNGYILLSISLLYLLLIKSFEVYRISIILGLGLFICSVLLSSNILFAFLDCAYIFYVIGTIFIGCYFPVKMKEKHVIKIICLIFCLFSVFGMLNPLMYQSEMGEFRYLGLFHGANASASIFSMLNIAVWEFEKNENKRIGILLFSVVVFFLYMWASGTRSLLFILPYWVYQLYNTRRIRMLSIIVSIIAILIYLPMFSEQITEKLRLDQDSSFNTRSALYQMLLVGIKNNYAIIPYGPHAATDMIRQYTRDPEFSPHNDILKFIYEWGVIFYVFCLYLIYKINKCVKFNFEFLLIVLAMLSSSLHNMLSTIYLWIPFMFILVARRKLNNTIYLKGDERCVIGHC